MAEVIDLNQLGLDPIELDGDTAVLGAVLILRTVRMSEEGNETGFTLRINSDTDFITLRGLLELARDHAIDTNPLALINIDDEDDPGGYALD
jgi:hypothetical protein